MQCSQNPRRLVIIHRLEVTGTLDTPANSEILEYEVPVTLRRLYKKKRLAPQSN